MTKGASRNWGFLPDEEIYLSDKLLDTGYVITEVEDSQSLDAIRNEIAALASEYLGISDSKVSLFLNQFHDSVSATELNRIRLHLIRKINEKPWFREKYFSLAPKALGALIGNELAMQRSVNLSIQLPQDDSSLLPVHADTWSGDSPFELVLWVPLVDCYETKSMFILPPSSSEILHERFFEYQKKSSEDLYRAIESLVEWIDIPYGKVLIFNQNLPHGNRVNDQDETRWSMNCRFKSLFSPYGDKKFGEFFVPATIRAATHIGINYRYPTNKGNV